MSTQPGQQLNPIINQHEEGLKLISNPTFNYDEDSGLGMEETIQVCSIMLTGLLQHIMENDYLLDNNIKIRTGMYFKSVYGV